MARGPGGGQTRPATDSEPGADQRQLRLVPRSGPIHCKRVRSLRGKFRFKLATPPATPIGTPAGIAGDANPRARRSARAPRRRPSESKSRDTRATAAGAAAGPQPRVARAGKMEPRGFSSCHSELWQQAWLADGGILAAPFLHRNWPEQVSCLVSRVSRVGSAAASGIDSLGAQHCRCRWRPRMVHSQTLPSGGGLQRNLMAQGHAPEVLVG
jgi:hypothetical protein